MYICENEEEFDALEDNQSEETIELTQKLFNDFILDNKVNYTTKYEVQSNSEFSILGILLHPV